MYSHPIAEQRRERWVDDVKVVACVLVFLGHTMQAMAEANIIPAEGFYPWFNQTIYFFHVPLFFLCSGYLYQRFSHVNAFQSWSKNVLKKLIVLGIPYFTFSFAVWLIKTLFPGAGNNEVGGLFDILFVHPTAPYWYLYSLFFCFFITITFQNTVQTWVGLWIALGLKAVSLFVPGLPYALSIVLENEIWFVLGMAICFFDLPKAVHHISLFIVTGSLFLILSFASSFYSINFQGFGFFMGLLACFFVVGFFIALEYRHWESHIMNFLAKYTLPIFLMHSIFAAALRTLLLKLGITSAWIHLPAAIFICLAGPVCAAWIMKKTKYLEFFLYPGKFLPLHSHPTEKKGA